MAALLQRLLTGTGMIPPAADPSAMRRLRLAIGLGGVAMACLSWRAWVAQGLVPAVPFVKGVPDLGPAAAGLLAAAAVAGWAALAAGFRPRLAAGVFLVAAAALFLQDQNRLQPWAYHLALAAAALGFASGRGAVALLRWLVVVIYFWSGAQKLNADFVDGPGRVVLAPLLGLAGLEPADLSQAVLTGLTLAMAAGETLLALLLVVRRTRRTGVVLAVGMHLAILYALGPFGEDWNRTVWPWNLLMIAQVILLFWPRDAASCGLLPASPGVAPRAVWLAFLLVGLLPGLKPFGWFDHYPSFALYSTWGETSSIEVTAAAAGALPDAVRAHLAPPDSGPDDVPWRLLRVIRWTEAELGVPPYPQHRVAVATAAALCERYALDDGIVVHLEARPGLLEEDGTLTTLRGCEDVRSAVGRYALGSRPAAAFAGEPSDRVMGDGLPWDAAWSAIMVSAWADARAGRFEGARRLYQDALGAAKTTAARARTLLLARTERRLGDRDASLADFETSASLYAVAAPGNPAATAVALERAALLEGVSPEEARARLAEVVALRERIFGGDDPLTGDARVHLAGLLLRTGRPGEALPLFLAALEAYERSPPLDVRVVHALSGAALAMVATGRAAEAATFHGAAVRRLRARLDPADPLGERLVKEREAFLDAMEDRAVSDGAGTGDPAPPGRTPGRALVRSARPGYPRGANGGVGSSRKGEEDGP